MNKRAIDPQPGERLRQLRLHREISQGQIARVIGVTVGTIQNYEHGRAGLGVDRIEQLARALQCEPVELLAPPGSAAAALLGFQQRQRYFPPRPGATARRIGTTVPPHLALAAGDGVK
jgi:transcriptional regulator with XRE-family HTH domain